MDEHTRTARPETNAIGHLLKFIPVTPLGDPATAIRRGLVYEMQYTNQVFLVVQVNFACECCFSRSRQCIVAVNRQRARCYSCFTSTAMNGSVCSLDDVMGGGDRRREIESAQLPGIVVERQRPPPRHLVVRACDESKIRRREARLKLPAGAPTLDLSDVPELKDYFLKSRRG